MRSKAFRFLEKYYIYIALFGCSLLFALFNIRDLDMITILGDEFGYWGNAEMLAGNDWSSLMRGSSFYSIGYSLFLVPLVFCVNNSACLYRLAVLLNAFFVFLNCIMLYYLSATLFDIKNKTDRVIVTFLSAFSVSTIFNIQVTWSETLLSTLFLVLICITYNIEKKTRYYLLIFFAIDSLLLILTHQRTIPVVIISVVLISLLLIKRKEYAQFLLMIFLFLGLGLIYKSFKSWQISSFYSGDGTIQNQISVVTGTQQYLYTLRHLFLTVLESFVCKVIAFSVISLFVGNIAIVCFFEDLVQKLLRRRISDISITKACISLSVSSMILLTAFQMHGYFRRDIPSYSRYFDFIISPILMYGYSLVSSNWEKHKRLYIIGYLFSAIGVYYLFCVTIKSTSIYNVPCNPFIGSYYMITKDLTGWLNVDDVAFNLLGKFSIVIGVIIAKLFKSDGTKKILCFVGIFVLLVYLSFQSSRWLNVARAEYRDTISLICEQIGNGDRIYYIKKDDDDNCVYAMLVQFYLQDERLIVLTKEEAASIQEPAWVLTTNQENEERKRPIISNDNLSLYFYK